jgi:hypothetical protein
LNRMLRHEILSQLRVKISPARRPFNDWVRAALLETDS